MYHINFDSVSRSPSFSHWDLDSSSTWMLVAVIVFRISMRKRAIDKHVLACDNVVISILQSEIIPDDCMSMKTGHQHANLPLNKIWYLIL